MCTHAGDLDGTVRGSIPRTEEAALLSSNTRQPVSQENLSPGNCVAATVFLLSLPINVATVYPKEILSPGNIVARMLAVA